MSTQEAVQIANQEGDQEFYDDEEEDSISELSSSPSIPDGDIDFNFVYALHTFMATVEGQATSTKGDTLVLLDDTNSYWWLVRNIKDDSIGYLPAEHIETPPERLARLNKHRNVEYGASQMIDLNPTTTKSSGGRKFSLRKSRKPATRAVTFSSPKIIQYEVQESDSESEGTDGAVLEPHEPASTVETNESVVQTTALESAKQIQSGSDRGGSIDIGSPGSLRSNNSRSQPEAKSAAENERGAETSDSGHKHKTSQSSFQSSEAGSSITTAEDGEVKEHKKKKGVFSGLFKKKSKRDKNADTTASVTDTPGSTTIAPVEPATKVEQPQSITQADTTGIRIDPLHRRVNTSELPEAVREMRSSVLMETDPVSVDMVDEPHSRGPVDEVEMLHTQRGKSPHSLRETAQDAQLSTEKESFVWTDRAVEAYLESEGDLYKRLLTVVTVKARSDRMKQDKSRHVHDHSFDGVQQSINQLLKDVDSLLVH